MEYDKSQHNSLQNQMDIISEENPRISIIKSRKFTSKMRTLKKIEALLKDYKIPYPNQDEIPELDDNLFEHEENIENYLRSLIEFNDDKFYTCSICKKFTNNYFCEICHKNICQFCYKKCLDNEHKLINLNNKLEEIENLIDGINSIFSYNFISSKKNINNEGIEKIRYDSQIMNEYEMNNEIEEKPLDYISDIELITKIIEKNYINYFHYKNIEKCYNYMINKYECSKKSSKQNSKESQTIGVGLENTFENYDDYITIIYKISNNDKIIKIFGKTFVENNNNIGLKIDVDKKIYELTEFFELKNLEQINQLEIKLIGINKIVNACCMFSECSSLISLPDIYKWNTTNLINISGMFESCSSLISLPDISKWNTSNINDMSYLFNKCSFLLSLPDVSEWDTRNVNNMSYMFNKCSFLLSLPDISKWDTSKVNDMSYMFSECSSLISLPKISKWNTSNVINISRIFDSCCSLKLLPDISKWNIKNVTDISGFFCSCSSLISIPDISKWNTSNVTDISSIFCECFSLISLPDVSEWNTSNVNDMHYIFSECSSLISLPNISKWNTSNVNDMSYMFNECSSLISLPDISKWNTSKVNVMNYMFVFVLH